MVDRPEENSNSNTRRLAFIYYLSWISFIVIFALAMKFLVGSPELLDDLDELETEQVSLEHRIPPTLQPLTKPLSKSLASRQVYVPFYRTLYVGENRAVKKLPATLSIHNTSTEHPLIVTKLTYYDGNGQVIVERLEKPHVLPPMAAAEFYIEPSQSDSTKIAATLLEWTSEAPISPPLIEAIVVGKYGAKGFSVLIRGINIPDTSSMN